MQVADLSCIDSGMKHEKNRFQTSSDGKHSGMVSARAPDRSDSHPSRERSCEGKWINAKENHDVDLRSSTSVSSSEYVNVTQSDKTAFVPRNNAIISTCTVDEKVGDHGSTGPLATKDIREASTKHSEKGCPSNLDEVSGPDMAKEGRNTILGAVDVPIDEVLALGKADHRCQEHKKLKNVDESNGEHSSSTITGDTSLKGFELRAEDIPIIRNGSAVENGTHNASVQRNGFKFNKQVARGDGHKNSNSASKSHSPSLHHTRSFEEMTSTLKIGAPQQLGTTSAVIQSDESGTTRESTNDRALSTEVNKFPDRNTSSIGLESDRNPPEIQENSILHYASSASVTRSQQQDVNLSSRNPDNSSAATDHDVDVNETCIETDVNDAFAAPVVRSQPISSRTDLADGAVLKSEDLECLSSPQLLQYQKDVLLDEKGIRQSTMETAVDSVASSGALSLHPQAWSSSGKLHYSHPYQADRLKRRVERFRRYFEALEELDQIAEEKQGRQSRRDRFRRVFEDA